MQCTRCKLSELQRNHGEKWPRPLVLRPIDCYCLGIHRMFNIFEFKAIPPIVLVHGGAGSYASSSDLLIRRQDFIRNTLEDIWPDINSGLNAVEAVVDVVAALEACPYFNAGLGAVNQSDGMARLSASLMDGNRRKFSGVLLASHIIHPSKLAFALQQKQESVVGPTGAQLIARELAIPPQNPVTSEKARQWAAFLDTQNIEPDKHGTVGCTVLDKEGRLAAATSTGGCNINFPDRISDSATVAGNYATTYAAISCTGIGEQIVDDGIAVRLETRVHDGMSIVEASTRLFNEACTNHRNYGWIGVDREGNWVLCCTSDNMPCAAMSKGLNAPLSAEYRCHP